jgi:GNAT superfamily N-acetyltransferase
VEIRVATSADVDACFEVQRRSALVGYAHIFPQREYPFPDDVVRKEWVERLESGRWVAMAAIDGEPAGTISTNNNRVESLFVVPEKWGSGVGGALLDAALAALAEQGSTAAELDVMADNLRARRFYESRGWARDGREEISPFPPYPRLVGYARVIEPMSRSKA